MPENIPERVAHLPWESIYTDLDTQGFASIPAVLHSEDCRQMIQLYSSEDLYRNVVNMDRYRFGSGEYKYFDSPLPLLVEELRDSFYPRLAPIANKWMTELGQNPSYPSELKEFLAECHRAGQTKPTPLILRYEEGGYNCLHQDLYGAVFFPFQVVLMLSEPKEYRGGEFMLLEQRPRAQSIGHVITLTQGEGLIFPTQYRPVRGKRGYYRAKLRHGVSRMKGGLRFTLGIIFHDAD